MIPVHAVETKAAAALARARLLTPQRSSSPTLFSVRRRQGFTLLELLVAVAIVAAIAGVAVIAADGFQDRARRDLIQADLSRIAEAARRFRADVGRSPKAIAELLQSPLAADTLGGWWWPGATPVPLYDPVIARGWNGPYLIPELRSSVSVHGIEPNYVAAIDSTAVDATGDHLALLTDVSQDTTTGASPKTVVSPFDFTISSGRLHVRFTDPSPQALVLPALDCGVPP